MSRRGKALKLNMVSTLFSEFVTLAFGLIMPRLVLLHFGSTGNGLVNSISQFLGFSTILRAGIGGAIRASLYKPLADNNNDALSSIMVATDKHMKKISIIIATSIMIFAVVYPFLIIDEYEWSYAFSMVLIIGFGSFAENLFGIKCKILLQADQKYYVQISITTITNIFVSLMSIAVILLGGSLRIMKIVAVIAALINPALLNFYVKRHYCINWKARPNFQAISQRWNAFFQQVAIVVNENVDLVVLTAFVALKEVSVYTVHAMIAFNIGKIVNSCVSGINSTFGDLYARKEQEQLKEFFKFSEWLVFVVGTIFYSVTVIMINSFVNLYTDSIIDVDYYRPVFSFLMVTVVFLNSTRIPYQMLAEGAGKFKETRNGAIFEAVLNIMISVIGVLKFGIVGVLLGTLISGCIRTLEYAFFCVRNLLDLKVTYIIKYYIILSVTYLLIYFVGRCIHFGAINNYFDWSINAFIVFVFSSGIVAVVSFVFYRKESKKYIAKLVRRRPAMKSQE